MIDKCICGADAINKIGTVTHNLRGKEIKLHNIPHTQCEECGAIWYDINEVKPSYHVVFAYKNGLDEIDYNEKI